MVPFFTAAKTCLSSLFITVINACFPVFPFAFKRSKSTLQAGLVLGKPTGAYTQQNTIKSQAYQ